MNIFSHQCFATILQHEIPKSIIYSQQVIDLQVNTYKSTIRRIIFLFYI